MSFEIVHEIKIKITEDDIKRLIIDEVARRDPAIIVDDIKFVQRRSPAVIDTEVTAHVEAGKHLGSPSVATVEVDQDTDKPELEGLDDELSPADLLLQEEETPASDLDAALADDEEEEEEEDPFE